MGLQDIQEEDEEEIRSENESDEGDAGKDVTLLQDGVTSDDTDMESFSKSCSCYSAYFLQKGAAVKCLLCSVKDQFASSNYEG